MHISPTEPSAIKLLGTVSSLPERYGADVLLLTPLGTVGVQRKECTDLVKSVHDGRLAKEVAQLQALSIAILIVEGKWRWTVDGQSLTARGWSRASHRGLMLSLQSSGLWVEYTDGLDDTIAFISQLEKWATKPRHVSTRTRPNPSSSWGKAGSRDWGVHLLQSFDGIGADIAGRIYDEFGGVPLRWSVTAEDLLTVPGIGKKRAATLMEALDDGRIGTGSP